MCEYDDESGSDYYYSSPYSSSSSSGGGGGDGVNVGAIAGGAVGGVVFLGLVAMAVVMYIRRQGVEETPIALEEAQQQQPVAPGWAAIIAIAEKEAASSTDERANSGQSYTHAPDDRVVTKEDPLPSLPSMSAFAGSSEKPIVAPIDIQNSHRDALGVVFGDVFSLPYVRPYCNRQAAEAELMSFNVPGAFVIRPHSRDENVLVLSVTQVSSFL